MWHFDVHGSRSVRGRSVFEERCVGPWDECDRDGREQESVRWHDVSEDREPGVEQTLAFALLVGVVFRLGGLRECVFGEGREEAIIG